MDKQEIFNIVYNGLKAQGFVKSVLGEIKRCAYRGDNDCKCAFGHLIPDEVYDKTLEDELARRLLTGAIISGSQDNLEYFKKKLNENSSKPEYVDYYKNLIEMENKRLSVLKSFKIWADRAGLSSHHLFIQELQNAHDKSLYPVNMKYNFEFIAKGHNLEIPE